VLRGKDRRSDPGERNGQAGEPLKAPDNLFSQPAPHRAAEDPEDKQGKKEAIGSII